MRIVLPGKRGRELLAEHADLHLHADDPMQTSLPVAAPTQQLGRTVLDDLSLLHRIREGDPDSFGLLHTHLRDRVWRIALGILRDRDAAEDAASEALIYIQEIATSGVFPPGPDEAIHWIRRVSRRCAFEQRREPLTVRGEWIEGLPNREHDDGDDPGLGGDARYATIMKAARRLAPKVRRAFEMHYFDRLTYTEIAERQGGTAVGACSRVGRGTLEIVAIIHSRQRGPDKAERAAMLPPEERVLIRNTVAIIRSRTPDIGLRPLAAEVCRRTKIFIRPESTSAFLLMDLHQRRT